MGGLIKSRAENFPDSLSSADRDRGRVLFRRFLLLNGVSVAFLMENMLILYSIRNGVSDPMVATLASFIHLTMPFMVFGKLLVARIGAAQTWGLGWFLRYVSASLMILAPFVAGVFSQAVVTGFIMAGAFGFAAFRSMGAVGNTPTIGEITTPADRGSFLSGNFVRSNSTHLIAMALVIMVLRYTEAMWVYQTVIGVGCGLGFYAATLLTRLPESKVPMQSARKPFKEAVRNLWRFRRVRRLLFAWSAGFIAFTMVIPFGMITVKNGYGISDHAALTFSLFLLLGGIASALVNGVVADRVGPRPLLLMYSGGLLLVAVFWALAPETFLPVPIGIAFFVAGYCKFGVIVSLGHYFLSVVDESDRVGSSLFMRILSGTVAGLAGSVVGGGLLNLLGTSGLTGLDVYRTYFRIAVAGLVLALLVIQRLERLEEWSIRNILGLLLSPRDMRALYVLNRLKNRSSSRGPAREVELLGDIGSALSEGELRDHLLSPRLNVRTQALRALGRLEFGPESEDAILRELTTGEYTTAWIAAEILGKHQVERAIPLLRAGLDSSDPILQGKCMVALVRLGDTQSYPTILEIFSHASNPRVIIHGANAVARMTGNDQLGHLLRKSLDSGLPSSAIDEVLTAAASTVGEGARFYEFLQRYNQDQGAGVAELLPDLSESVVSGEAERLRKETSAAGERSLCFFRRAITDVARRAEKQPEFKATATAVGGILQSAGDTEIPNKTLFCMALILSGAVADDDRFAVTVD